MAGDAGHMYMELRGAYNSLSEGGLFVANNDDHNINPYVRVQTYPGGGYAQMNNYAARYDCQYLLGIVSGATFDGRYVYTAVGQVPSSCNPQQKFCDGNAFTFVKQAWLFANAPADIIGSGIDAAGVRTPCTPCSISRVTTVAQSNVNTYSENGGVFGADSLGRVFIHYMQTAYGEWESNCTPGTSLCTFVFSMTPSKYYGGYQYYPNTIDAVSTVNGAAPTTSPWESYDGISLQCCSGATRTQDLVAGGSFTLTPPTPIWNERIFVDSGVEKWDNWLISYDSGTSWAAYCTEYVNSDEFPPQQFYGSNCDGNENTDHPSLPYPGNEGEW